MKTKINNYISFLLSEHNCVIIPNFGGFVANYESRNDVFVVEQGVNSCDEYDRYEISSKHYLIKKNNVSCGVARWRKTQKGIKLERFAVLYNYRGFGVGKRLVREVLKDVLPFKKLIYLHSQKKSIKFYEKLSFKKEGDIFKEAGIDHCLMIFKS